MTTTMADAAAKGLDVATHDGIVRVRDGVDTWLCLQSAWDAAVSALSGRDADADDEHGAEAYSALCGSIQSPVASIEVAS